MSKFKNLLLALIPLSVLLPYSNTCGSPFITNFTTNQLNKNSTLLRSSVLGSVTTFLVRNLSTNSLEEIQFQLLVTDGVSNFYAEVLEISNGNIDLASIDALFQTFTSSTLDADSLYLQNGIKAAEEAVLGLPPTIDESSEVHILFMDIRDGYSNSGEFVAGFFDPQDQMMCLHKNGLSWQPEATENTCISPYEWSSNGNGLNIIYIDSNPARIDEDGLENALFTLAHEYQHLLHWNADLKEGYFGSVNGGWAFHNPWLNEGLSDLMPSILGLGLRDFSPYLSNPIIGLDEWSEIGSPSTLPYYAKSALFFQYLYESEGLNLISTIFTDTKQGLASIKSNYDDNGFESLYANWIQSLVLGRLVNTSIDTEVYAKNIENQISMGAGNALVKTEGILPEYSFTLFSVPEYISIKAIESADYLNIILYNEGTFLDSYDFIEEDVNAFEGIILYSKNVPVDNIFFDLLYDYIASPNKNNLFVYPNPITENILSYIYFGDANNSVISINLFDLSGRQILSIQNSADSYNNYSGDLILSLSSGIYIIQSVLGNGISEYRHISIIK